MDLPAARRLAVSVVLGQAALTAVIAGLCFVVFGPLAGQSAALGGGINVLAGLAMVLFAFGRKAGTDPAGIARSFFIGEGVKLAVMVGSFVVVLTTLKVSMGALFATYVATFFVYWLALANALPSFTGRRPARAGSGLVD
jgi:F0F1-type ATP synthase assembly protein I